MLNNFRKRLVATTLLSAALVLGCDDRSPTAPTVVLPPVPTPTPAPTAMPPRVLGVMPDRVATTVPTVVVLVGHRFHQEATVTFGGTPGNIVRATETFLMVMTPIHEAGNVEIVVTNPDGLSGRLTGGFTYEVAPAGVPSIESISPTLGVTTGGTWVEIFGTGFHFGSTIKVDGELVRPLLNPTGSLGFATLAARRRCRRRRGQQSRRRSETARRLCLRCARDVQLQRRVDGLR